MIIYCCCCAGCMSTKYFWCAPTSRSVFSATNASSLLYVANTAWLQPLRRLLHQPTTIHALQSSPLLLSKRWDSCQQLSLSAHHFASVCACPTFRAFYATAVEAELLVDEQVSNVTLHTEKVEAQSRLHEIRVSRNIIHAYRTLDCSMHNG